MVFGLGMRLQVLMCAKLDSSVLQNERQPQSVVNVFIDQGEFEAMNTLSGQELHVISIIFVLKSL